MQEARAFLSSSFPSNGARCGSLLCQHDSNIKSFDTHISGIVKVMPEENKVSANDDTLNVHPSLPRSFPHF